MYEDAPSESDLAVHSKLIKEAALRDKDMAKAKVCVLSPFVTAGHLLIGLD